MPEYVLAQIAVTAKVVITDPQAVVQAALRAREEAGDNEWTVEELSDPAQAVGYLFDLEEGTNGLPGGVAVLNADYVTGPLQEAPDKSLLDRAQFASELAAQPE